MDKAFITILQNLITEQGKEALLNSSKCKAFLADYTRGEYEKESRLLLQALDAGAAKALNAADDIALCRKQQIRVLHEEYFMTEEAAADVLDTLALVLRGEEKIIRSFKMFCQKCGSPIDEGTEFCPKCGTKILTAEAVKSESIKANTGSVTGNAGKLIRIAAIVAIGMWLLFSAVVFYINVIQPIDFSRSMEPGLPMEERERVLQSMAERYTFSDRTKDFFAGDGIIIPIFLAMMAISIVLSFLGWKKNNRIMVLIAGIIYIYPVILGIPSGIMCIIAFRKMKKPA